VCRCCLHGIVGTDNANSRTHAAKLMSGKGGKPSNNRIVGSPASEIDCAMVCQRLSDCSFRLSRSRERQRQYFGRLKVSSGNARMSLEGRQRQNVAGIGEAASAAAVRHIGVVRDSDFRLLPEPVVASWLKVTLARRPDRPTAAFPVYPSIYPAADVRLRGFQRPDALR